MRTPKAYRGSRALARPWLPPTGRGVRAARGTPDFTSVDRRRKADHLGWRDRVRWKVSEGRERRPGETGQTCRPRARVVYV